MSQFKEAPWTTEDVLALQLYQQEERFHPYTCECKAKLIPTIRGWECQFCDYKQDWCHQSSIDYYKDKINGTQTFH